MKRENTEINRYTNMAYYGERRVYSSASAHTRLEERRKQKKQQ